jgi:hypothetical protein
MRPAVTSLLLLLLSACSTITREFSVGAAFIAPGVLFQTPGPAELGYPIEAIQLVVASFRGERVVFESRVSCSPERLTLVTTDGFGRRALTAHRTAAAIMFDAAEWVPTGLRAENILADMALVYWPKEAVDRALAGSPARLEMRGNERSIVIDGREIINVAYEGSSAAAPWTGMARFQNRAFGYALELRSTVIPR